MSDTPVQSALTACSSFHNWRRATAEASHRAQLEEVLAAATQDEARLLQLQQGLAASEAEAQGLKQALEDARAALAAEAAAREEVQGRAAGLARALEASEAARRGAESCAGGLREQLQQVQGELATKQAAAELAGRETDAVQQAAAAQARELRAAQAAAAQLSGQLSAEAAAAAAAREAAQHAQARAAELEVALADEAMKRELEAAKLSTLQRKLAESQLRCADLEAEAERGLAAEAAAAPPLACGLREENAALRAQLGAAVERLGEFGVSLSKAAQGLGEPEAEGPLGSPLWEACAAAEEGGGEGGGSQRSGSGQPGGGSSCSEGEGEGAAQGEDILDAGEETEAAEEAGSATTDSLLAMIMSQQQRIEELEEALQAASERQATAASVARQTAQKLMGELARSQGAAQQLAKSLAAKEAQLAAAEAQAAAAEAQRAAAEAALAVARGGAAQQREAGEREAFLLQERLVVAEALAREASERAEGLQAQLEKERAAAVRQLAELQRATEERLLAGVAAGMHAAEAEVAALRARLAETEEVAQAVIGKLEARLAAKEGAGREAASQLQARCAAAVRAGKEALSTLEAERELWACVRATYVQRACRSRAALQRELLLRRAWAAWRLLAVTAALREMTHQFAASAAAAGAVATSAAAAPPPVADAEAVPAPEQPAAKAALQQAVLPVKAAPSPAAEVLAGLPVLPFTIPAIGPTAASPPAFLAIPAALLAGPCAMTVSAVTMAGYGKSPAAVAQAAAVASSGEAQPLGLPAVLSIEASEWTTVSTEAVAELLLEQQEQLQPSEPARQLTGQSPTLAAAPAGAESRRAATAAAVPQASKPSVSGRRAPTKGRPALRRPSPPAPAHQGTQAAGPAAGAAAAAGAAEAAQQQQQLGGGHQVRKVPKGAKHNMVTGSGSPAPWVPSSKHARVLASFDIKPSPTVATAAQLQKPEAGRQPKAAASRRAQPGGGAVTAPTTAAATVATEAEQAVPPAGEQPAAVAAVPAVGEAAAAIMPDAASVRNPQDQQPALLVAQPPPLPEGQQQPSAARAHTPEDTAPEPRSQLPAMHPLASSSSACSSTWGPSGGPISEHGAAQAAGGELHAAAAAMQCELGPSAANAAAAPDVPTAEGAPTSSGERVAECGGLGACGEAEELRSAPAAPAPLAGGCRSKLLIRRVALSTPVVARRGGAAASGAGGGGKADAGGVHY